MAKVGLSPNVVLRDLDITLSHRSDARRLEVIAEGLTLFGGSQLAMDATVVSPLHADGTHRRKADTTDGQSIGGGTQAQGKNIPRVVPWEWSRAAGGRRRGRRQIVPANQGFLVVLAAKAACVPRSTGLFHGKVSRFISVGRRKLGTGSSVVAQGCWIV